MADHANDIVQTTGGYLVVGTTKSDDGDVSFNHGTEDVWLIKIDSSEPCYGKKPMVVQAVMVQSEYLRRPVFILYCWRFVVI